MSFDFNEELQKARDRNQVLPFNEELQNARNQNSAPPPLSTVKVPSLQIPPPPPRIPEVSETSKSDVDTTSTTQKRKHVDSSDGEKVVLDGVTGGASERSSEARSKIIEAMGLKHASHFKKIALTEGLLRMQLRLINSNMEAAARNSKTETLLPASLIDRENIRLALQIQEYKISPEIIPAVCVCGEGVANCGLDNGKCTPDNRRVSCD